MRRHRFAVAVAAVITFAVGGCVFAPHGTREERARAAAAGRPWEHAAGAPALAPPGAASDWPELLRYALVTNGMVEAAYHEWRAALARIDVAAAYPNTNVSLDYEYLFSNENLKAWDRNSLRVGFDPMQNLSFPTKPLAAGRVALADAQAAGDRFRAAKLAVQRDLLTAWADYALAAEQLRLARESAVLAALGAEANVAATAAGPPQGPALEALAARARSDDVVQTLEAAVAGARARVNAAAGRPADAPLDLPAALPPPRRLPDDAAVLAAGVRNDPELAALAHAHAGRSAEVAAARQEWIPDVNPFVGIEGGMAQIAGMAVSLPARVTMIRGQIAAARAMEAAAAAERTQAERDRLALFLDTLASLRAAERRSVLYADDVVPIMTQLTATARADYEAGTLELAMFIDAERATLEARAMLAEARMERERQLAVLEALGGFDAETLSPRPVEDPS